MASREYHERGEGQKMDCGLCVVGPERSGCDLSAWQGTSVTLMNALRVEERATGCRCSLSVSAVSGFVPG